MWKKNIVNLLDSMVYDRSYYEIVSDFFELSAIAIRNTVDLRPPLRQQYEERYLQTAKHYRPEQLQKFGQALAIFQDEIAKGGYPQSPVVMKSTSQPKIAAKNEPLKKTPEQKKGIIQLSLF